MADLTPEGVTHRVKTLVVVQTESDGVLLKSAPVVVAGVAGVGCIDGWKEIEVLAGVLNAALGSSQPAVDEGWRP